MAASAPARLILICGLPAAGKSTLARDLANTIPAIRLNKDDCVRQLGQDVWDDEFRGRIEARLWDLAQELLAHDMSVILEWGHWARRERDEKRLRARNLDAHVELQYLDVPLDVLIARIERRQRSGEWIDAPITRAQMERWAATFEAPDDAELALFDPPTTAAPAKL